MPTFQDRRTVLLEKIVGVLLTSGAGNLSLRPLAQQVETSARLLIYHFESKERLIADALTEVRARIVTSLGDRAARTDPRSVRSLLAMFWDWATEPPNQPYFRLLFEVDGLARYDRVSFSAEVHRANSRVWTGLIERAATRLSHDGDLFSAHATLIMCSFSGLLQEFLSTGDRERTTTALLSLIDRISPAALPHRPMEGSGL